MKFITVIFILISTGYSLHAQVKPNNVVLSCHTKLNKWAMWEQTKTVITITENFVSVQEVQGIVLAIEYDSKAQVNNLWHYSYRGSVRTTHSTDVTSDFLITVLNDHYQCRVKL